MTLTVEQHAYRARVAARAAGCADCIHYAPNWARRADALYASAIAAGIVPGSPYLLHDGRMVVVCEDPEVWFFEPKWEGGAR